MKESRRRWRRWLAWSVLGWGLAGCDDHQSKVLDVEGPVLTVFVAASLGDVMSELGERYTGGNEVRLDFNFAGSGALAQQLLAAPRADVFLSANERWMDAVEEAGLLLPGSRSTLLSNRLVLVSHASADYRLDALTDLPGLTFAFLSVGDPAYVPAGRYARAWLEHASLEEGGDLWAELGPRLAPAADVRAALQQVAARRDVLGIVYQTDARAREGAVRILWEQGEGEPPEIRYPVAVLQSSDHSEEARAFVAFLQSAEAAAVFERHGFIVHSPSSGVATP